jgi:hypothetical protein
MVFYGCVLATLAASLTIIGLPSSVWLIGYNLSWIRATGTWSCSSNASISIFKPTGEGTNFFSQNKRRKLTDEMLSQDSPSTNIEELSCKVYKFFCVGLLGHRQLYHLFGKWTERRYWFLLLTTICIAYIVVDSLDWWFWLFHILYTCRAYFRIAHSLTNYRYGVKWQVCKSYFQPLYQCTFAYIFINAIYLDCIAAILVVTIRVNFSMWCRWVKLGLLM